MSLLPGTRLGSCEIVSLIGAGGMGEVYRARDSRLGRDVAIKVLPPSFAADADRLARFEQEARAAGALNHPNLVTIHELGRHDGQVFIVSELLDGESLRERLSGGPLSVSRATDYAAQIANGLAAAHEKGIVHRDVKPENIFITSDGRVKILDFGLAKLSTASDAGSNLPTANVKTDPGTVMGTVGYMSPEQVRGQTVDHRSDIFSFGAVLYEMLSGRRAFKGDSAADTMSAVLREDAPEISQSGRIVPPALERIIHHCLEKSPAQRFQSARDLAFDLQSMSTTSSGQQSARGRNLRPLGLAAAGLALLAAGIGIGFIASRRTKPPSVPSFKLLTFRKGGVDEARFTPDGQTIIYAATWEGHPFRTYAVSATSPISRDLGLGDDISATAVSSTGELATLNAGKLARVPMAGGAPREVASMVGRADWTPDGKDLVIFRRVGEQFQIEFPIDHPVYKMSFTGGGLRVSRDGQWVAFTDCRSSGGPCAIAIVNRQGEKKVLTDGLTDNVGGYAWSADGNEVWFTAPRDGRTRALFAVDLKGRVRSLLQLPTDIYIQDVAPNGDVLLEMVNPAVETLLTRAGEPARDYSWLDGTVLEDLTADGKAILFFEDGLAEPQVASYLRQTDGSPPVRLGQGYAERLSPSGDSALVYQLGKPPRQTVVPTGAGATTVLSTPSSIVDFNGIEWMPDGRRVIYSANENGGRSRIFVQPIDSSIATPITSPGTSFVISCKCLSPDGKWLVVFNEKDQMLLQPTAGGPARPLPNLQRGLRTRVAQWTADGRKLVVHEQGPLPRQIDLYDVATATRTPFVTFNLADPSGFTNIQRMRLSSDLKTIVYSYHRTLSRLVLVHGLK
jgi:eukaryotic-like serine/threonine-protein kinase